MKTLSVVVRAKGDNRVSKRRHSVVSKRRLSEQMETNAEALLCGLLMVFRDASRQPRMEFRRTATWAPAWNPVNNGSDWACPARRAPAVSSSKAKNPRGPRGRRPPPVATRLLLRSEEHTSE